MKDLFSSVKKFGKSLLILFLYMIVLPGIGFAIFITKGFNDYGFAKQNILLICCELVSFISVMIYFRKDLLKDIKDFKENYKENFKIIIKYWLIGMGIMIIFNFIINIVLFNGSIAANEELNRGALVKYPIYSIVAMIITGPICEEIIFRLNFKKSIKNENVFLIFTTLLFAGVHLMASFDTSASLSQILYIFPYGALGFAFGKIYLKTNNICSSIIAHMLQNALSIAIILISIF